MLNAWVILWRQRTIFLCDAQRPLSPPRLNMSRRTHRLRLVNVVQQTIVAATAGTAGIRKSAYVLASGRAFRDRSAETRTGRA
jgi:hypothetical protein